MTNQKISPQKNSSTLRKTLSSYALNGWEEPNLVCRIYKHVRIILCKFDLITLTVPTTLSGRVGSCCFTQPACSS